MSADSYHALVETAMRKMKYLYDFSDFESAVASHGAQVVNMEVDDFFMIKSGVSSAKLGDDQPHTDYGTLSYEL